ncbi:hypothetical protein [Burkholderia sp. 22PA0106]
MTKQLKKSPDRQDAEAVEMRGEIDTKRTVEAAPAAASTARQRPARLRSR